MEERFTNSIKVGDLVDVVEIKDMAVKCERVEKILRCKMFELRRAKAVVTKLEKDLEEFKQMPVVDVDTSDYRY